MSTGVPCAAGNPTETSGLPPRALTARHIYHTLP